MFFVAASSSVPEYKYVRTDSRATTLDAFVYKPEEVNTEAITTEVIKKPRVEVRLTSVLQLRKEIKKQENIGTILG